MSDASATDSAPALPHETELRTTLSRKWSLKMGAFLFVGLVFLVWGVIDAVIVYPNRGARAAEFAEFQWLRELQGAGQLTNDRASIPNPVEVFDRLRTKSGEGGKLTAPEQATLDWLSQLHHIKRLDPANTVFPRTDFRPGAQAVGSADERLAALSPKFTTADGTAKAGAKPLSWYDIPSQWIIAAVGAVVAGSVGLSLLRARASNKYRWNPALQRLTLPTGESLLPADIAEFDKTKWDKVYIHLHIKPEHPALGGKVLELDLLRYEPLEEWVLAMEQTATGGSDGRVPDAEAATPAHAANPSSPTA